MGGWVGRISFLLLPFMRVPITRNKNQHPLVGFPHRCMRQDATNLGGEFVIHLCLLLLAVDLISPLFKVAPHAVRTLGEGSHHDALLDGTSVVDQREGGCLGGNLGGWVREERLNGGWVGQKRLMGGWGEWVGGLLTRLTLISIFLFPSTIQSKVGGVGGWVGFLPG